MDDHKLPLDLTIYGAIHQHEGRKRSGSTALPSSLIWQGVYSVKFKKVPGPPPTAERKLVLWGFFYFLILFFSARGDDQSSRSRSPGLPLSSLPDDAPHSKILRLLRVLHKLNAHESERLGILTSRHILPESAFVNNKLTAKLTRQLEEPMIVTRCVLRSLM